MIDRDPERYLGGRLVVYDTVLASTEVHGKRDFPGRPDLGVLAVRRRSHYC